MQTWVILLRGINVGGKNMLPMARLVALCQAVGFKNTRHYLQSGNLVAQSVKSFVVTKKATELGALIADEFGFEPHIQIISADDFMAAASASPFKDQVKDQVEDQVSLDEGKAVHLYFLDAQPQECAAKLESIKDDGEVWILKDRVFYLRVIKDFHKSKLAARAEKILGVKATARNWRTVSKIVEMLE